MQFLGILLLLILCAYPATLVKAAALAFVVAVYVVAVVVIWLALLCIVGTPVPLVVALALSIYPAWRAHRFVDAM